MAVSGTGPFLRVYKPGARAPNTIGRRRALGRRSNVYRFRNLARCWFRGQAARLDRESPSGDGGGKPT